MCLYLNMHTIYACVCVCVIMWLLQLGVQGDCVWSSCRWCNIKNSVDDLSPGSTNRCWNNDSIPYLCGQVSLNLFNLLTCLVIKLLICRVCLWNRYVIYEIHQFCLPSIKNFFRTRCVLIRIVSLRFHNLCVTIISA